MANIDLAAGLRPVRNATGAAFQGSGLTCYANDASNAIGIGDIVTLTGSGDAAGIPAVRAAVIDSADTGNNDPIFGVVTGIQSESDGSIGRDTLKYVPANTNYYVQVTPADRDTLFAVQEDSVGGALAVTNIGQYANLIRGTVSTTTGRAAVEIDSSTATATSAGSVELDELNVRLVGYLQSPDNEVGANAEWLVQINYSQFEGVSNAADTAE